MYIYSVWLTLMGIGVGVAGSHTANTTCTMDMFGGDFNAYMACKAQFALQSNWWPSPIAGLFSYQVRNQNQRIRYLIICIDLQEHDPQSKC